MADSIGAQEQILENSRSNTLTSSVSRVKCIKKKNRGKVGRYSALVSAVRKWVA